ncbi:uncharacterized protein LOC121979185 isoform X2 [Zingiber officinale]|uniref:uncharacterized protein LOC121979185 isoform X2 n=1 Tax=Zingiber officinale TaxID=94328 RepID=UPI001C4CC416|nr:uncharacterized protein LOC121979185 isoform X2 [Zingiber officinale]
MIEGKAWEQHLDGFPMADHCLLQLATDRVSVKDWRSIKKWCRESLVAVRQVFYGAVSLDMLLPLKDFDSRRASRRGLVYLIRSTDKDRWLECRSEYPVCRVLCHIRRSFRVSES